MDLAIQANVVKVFAVLAWSVLGIAVTYGSYRLIDALDPMDIQAEISKGNVAAAVKMGAMLLVIGAIVIAAMVS